MQGCTSPYAANYNSLADQDDGSCLFLYKIGETCYSFSQEPPLRDESFTLSFSVSDGNWVFYHGYVPDFYYHSRDSLYSIKNRRIYKHNAGAPGKYYEPDPKSFFMDLVFTDQQDMILNTVEWISEVINSLGMEQEFRTFTHITIWNSQQCTGKIPLVNLRPLDDDDNMRRMKGAWSFNDFRDMIKNRDGDFLQDLFGDFAVKSDKLTTKKSWFDKALMEDRYFIVRLEYDNSDGNTVFLHDTTINENESDR
jgi:hypothetical protein